MNSVGKKYNFDLHFVLEEEETDPNQNLRMLTDESPNDVNSMENSSLKEEGYLGDQSYSSSKDLLKYLKNPLEKDLSRYLPKPGKTIYFPKKRPSDLTEEDLKVYQIGSQSFPPTFGCVFSSQERVDEDDWESEEESSFSSPTVSMTVSPLETLEEFLRKPTPNVSFPKKEPSGLTSEDLAPYQKLSKSYPLTQGCVFPASGIEECSAIRCDENDSVESGKYTPYGPDTGLHLLLKPNWFKKV